MVEAVNGPNGYSMNAIDTSFFRKRKDNNIFKTCPVHLEPAQLVSNLAVVAVNMLFIPP